MRLIKFLGAILFALAVMVQWVDAATPTISSVTGTIANDSTIVISGNNFGTNPAVGTDSIEWLGPNIEAGAGTFSAPGWTCCDYATTSYATDQKHSGSKSLKVLVVPTGEGPANQYNGDIHFAMPGLRTGKSIHVAWWVRCSAASSTGQWKMLRLNNVDGIVDDAQELYVTNWFDNSPTIILDPSAANAHDYYIDNNSMPANDATWYRCELSYTHSSGNGTTDGKIKWSITKPGSIYMNQYDSTYTGVSSFVTGYSNPTYNYLIFQNYRGNGAVQTTIWTDDIFVQVGNLARVELGNKSTLGLSDHKEIQIPTSWSSTSVTATINAGSFASNDSVYVFVINSGDTTSVGYGKKLGDGGATYSKGKITCSISR